MIYMDDAHYLCGSGASCCLCTL